MTAEQERAAVVAWLRSQADKCAPYGIAGDTIYLAADRIERGEHLRGGE